GLRLLVTPKSVNVHHRKRSVLLRGHLNPDCISTVVYQVVVVEKVLPVLAPPRSVKAPQHEFPPRGVMVAGRRWPRPNHVWMNHVQKEVWVPGIPAHRLPVHQRLNLLPHGVRHGSACAAMPLTVEERSINPTPHNRSQAPSRSALPLQIV